MTFDARGGPGGSGNTQNLIFGGAVVAIVGAAFGLTFMFSGAPTNPASPQAAPSIVANIGESGSSALAATFEYKKEARYYFAALQAVDAKAYDALERKLSRASRASDTKRVEIVMEHAASVFKDHSGDLAHADASHVDNLLDLTRSSLKKASRARTPFCDGSNYAGLTSGSAAAQKKAEEIVSEMGTGMNAFSFEALTILMNAILDARANPVRHGKVTNADEMAMQGVIMSMISDPQVRPLLLARQQGKTEEEMLAGVNICHLGSTFLMALKTLPQDTKGRLWAKAVKEAELGGGNMGGFGF